MAKLLAKKNGYRWRAGARFGLASASKVGKELEDFCKESGRTSVENITPEYLVKRAENKKFEVHKCFEWSDTKAAKEYRLHQARQVLSSIVVVKMVENPKTKQKVEVEIKAFENVSMGEDGSRERTYVPTRVAMKDLDMRTQIAQRLIDSAQHLENVATEYSYLDEAFEDTAAIVQRARVKLEKKFA